MNVDLTGEIYLVCDQFSNQNITRELGKMGVQTRRSLTVSSFLKDAIIPKVFRKGETHLQRAYRLAKPYLMRDIGGDSLECVSDVAYADERGIDGIIHISPFTCMPESCHKIYSLQWEKIVIFLFTFDYGWTDR